MNNLEKAELTVSICYIERFSKSGIQIYNSEVPKKSRKDNEMQLQSVMLYKQTQYVVNLRTM